MRVGLHKCFVCGELGRWRKLNRRDKRECPACNIKRLALRRHGPKLPTWEIRKRKLKERERLALLRPLKVDPWPPRPGLAKKPKRGRYGETQC